VTGGGSGMGQELVRQLVAGVCNVRCATFGGREWWRRSGSLSASAMRRRTGTTPIGSTCYLNGNSGSMIAHSHEEWEPTFNILLHPCLPANAAGDFVAE